MTDAMTHKELQDQLMQTQVDLATVKETIMALRGEETVSFTAKLLEEEYVRLSNDDMVQSDHLKRVSIHEILNSIGDVEDWATDVQ
jgi:hypothetical protein